MSLPKPNDKKSSNGLPILDGSFNIQPTKKQSPTIPTKSSGGLPVIDSSYNQFIEKKNGGSESVTTSLTQSESPSQSELPERESPTSFLSNDIEQTQLFSSGDVPAFDPRSLSEPTTPRVQDNLMNEDKITERQKILSEPNALSSYAKNRVNKIKSEISQLENVDLERFAEYGATSVPGAPLTKTFKPGAESVQQQIEEKKDYLNKLRNSSAAQMASLILPKYLENPTTFNPKELGRELVRASSPDLESKFQLVENEGKPIPGIQSADLEKTGIDLMKSYIGDYKFPPKEQIDAANTSLAEMDSRLAANPRDISLKNKADALRKQLDEVNNIQKMKQQISVYEKDFEEKNYELTWSTVKDKLGAYFHAKDDSGVFGYNTEKLMQAVNDPAVGLTAGEKAVALNYGIPLESKLLGTDIPGSGLVRSFKNAVEQSVTGTWETIASESNKRLGINLGRTEADQASELLNEETGGSRFRSVGDNPRATSELSALRAKETSGKQLNDNEKSRKVELQKYVDVRTNWDKVKDLTGNLTGQVAAIAVVAKGVGVIGNVASKVGTSLGATASGLTSSTIGSVLSNEFGGLFISSYLFAKDGYDKQAIDLMPGENQAAARDSYSSLMSGFEAGTEMIFRDTKVLDGFMGKLSPNLAKVTKNYINGNITSQAARDEINSFISKYVKSAGKEFVTSIGENATEESAIDILQGVTNAGFGIEDWDLYKTGTKAVDTFVSTAIGSGIIGSMAGHGAYRKANNQSRFMKATVADMAVNPAKYLRSVEELQAAGEISQQQANDKIKIIKSSSKFLGELPATREVPVVDNDGNEVVVSKKFDYPEATSYVLHRLNEGILTEKLDATTDPIEQSVLKKQISQSEKIRKGIYEGKIGVTPNIDPVSNNPEEAQELGILSAEAVSPSDLIGTPFKKETPTEAGVPEVSVNEKEQAAIEGLQNKDFANSTIKPYTDVIQNPDASIADKKEALKGLSDQLTARGTEITVGEALGKEADLIYGLGYEPAQESEAIRAVTEGASGINEEGLSDAGNGNLEKGSKIQWNVFGNEGNEEWTVGDKVKTRGGADAVVLSKRYIESAKDGKTYSKEYADANGIKYVNEPHTIEHTVPLEDLQNPKTDNIESKNKPTISKEQQPISESVDEGVDADTKTQIENFGVPKEDVEATHGVISQILWGLKKAGLTAANTVGDWVGIGKGEANPNSLDGIVEAIQKTLPKVENKETVKEQPKTESEIPTWIAEFERTKTEKDLVKMEELYNKIKVVQNGVLQGRIKDPIVLEKTIKQLNDLKKQIEDYAENWKKENQPKVSEVTETDTKKQPINKIEDLQDVGEKIGGAKKDLAQKLSEVTTEDLATKPLSKVFPKPDFKKLVEEGSLSEDGAILLNFLYEKIPAKPRKQYRVANWVKTVDSALQTTRQVLEAESTKNLDFTDKILKAVTLSETLKRDYKLYSDTMKGLGFPKNDVNLGGYEIKKFENRSKFNKETGKLEPVKGEVYSIVSGSSIIGDFKTMDDAINGLKTILNKSEEKTKGTRFDIYQDKKTKEFFIGKKGAIDVVRVMQGFKTLGEARNFLKEKQADIQGLWDAMKAPKERRMANRPRVGVDWRKGKNVDSKEFADTFGFRGVEFGNWVNNAERQSHVNEAYDALMDLSSVLGVSPKALSLNGELGFAFGARGSGKANAHYESGKVVINLTKTRGAGSLAHEWWHAMDNYFSRNRGQKESFITQSPRDRIERDGSRNQGVRKEMIDAFKSVMDAIEGTKLSERSKVLDRTRSEAYWSTPIEMSARAFENYIIEKLGERNQQNDYLANFKETAEWINDTKGDIDALKNYPYPLAEESPIVNEKFQQFFETIKEDESNKLFKDAEAQYRIDSGKNIIEAIKDFNKSKNKARATVALIHEIMHPTVVAIIDGAKDGNEVGGKHTETIVNEFNKANPNNKVTVLELITGNENFKEGNTGKQYRAVQEFIAKSWEQYHTEGGKGFSEAFQKVLDQITKAFQSVYKSITGKELTPELKQMFDDILGKEQPLSTKSENKPTISKGPSIAKEEPKKKAPSKKKLTSIEEVENELRDLFAMDRIVGIPVGEKTNTIEQYLEKAKAVLSQLYPDATITTYDTAEEYYDKEGRPVGSAGVFHPKEQRLALNLELIAEHGAENTIFHEVIHPIVNEAILSKEGALDDVFEQLKALKDIPGMDAVHEHIQAYAGRGINIQKVEGITEFLTQVADGRIDLSGVPEKTSSKVIDLINKIFEALGISLRISTATDLKRLSDAIKTSFDNADASAVSELIGRRADAAVKESFDAILPEEQERIIKDIISRSEGVPQEQLKATIKKYTGWSDEKIDSFFGKTTGITHAQTQETASEFSFEGYEPAPETFDEWDKEAMSLIESGYDIEGLIKRLEEGKLPTNIEQRIMGFYLATQEAAVEKDPSKDNVEKLMRAVRASDVGGGRLVGQSLAARKGFRVRDNSLAGFFIGDEEANEAPLTDNQRKEVVDEYNKIQDAQRLYEEKIISLGKENARLRAEKELSKEKKSSTKSKKTHSEYVSERKEILTSIKDKLKAARTGESGLTAVPVPYAKELFVIAPDVMKLTRSLLSEGVSKLDDIVREIHSSIKDSIDGLTEKDIHDIIAGDYNTPRPTRREINKSIVDLRTEAKLINRISELNEGSVPKTEKAERERNREIESLKKQIRNHDITKLSEVKKRINKQISDLENDLKTGNYQEPETTDTRLPVKLDKEAIELKDKLIKLRQQRAERLAKLKYENRTLRKRAVDRTLEIMNVPRTIMASMDYSAPLRQAVIPTVSHPIMAAKAAAEMFRQSVSQKRFDRWFFDLQQTPRYELMKRVKLYVADPHDPRLSTKEEAFMNNLAEKIPFLGRLIKGSERAYVGFLNKMRVDLFNRLADGFENDGLTYENNPELYDATARMVNNFTGRGGLGPIESTAPVLNSIFFSPRLIASRFNILGLSDVATFGKGFYSNLPPKLRVAALGDLAKFVGVGTTLLGMLALWASGGDDDDKDKIQVETDPRSSDFGKIRSGNTRWDIWGGFQPYVRLIAQLITGERKATSSGQISSVNKFGQDKGTLLTRFVRGKLAPVPSTALNLLTGRNIVGEKVTVKSEAMAHLQPLIVSDMKDAIKDRGVGALFTHGLPSVFGVGVQTYLPRGYDKVDTKAPVYKELYEKGLNLTTPEQGEEMDDKVYEKFTKRQHVLFKEKWDNVIKYGAYINEEGNPTIDIDRGVSIKPFNELSNTELTTLMKSISNSATRTTKKELDIKPLKK